MPFQLFLQRSVTKTTVNQALTTSGLTVQQHCTKKRISSSISQCQLQLFQAVHQAVAVLVAVEVAQAVAEAAEASKNIIKFTVWLQFI